MAQDEKKYRDAGVAREALINVSEFLRSIVETTVQRRLDFEILEHLHAGLIHCPRVCFATTSHFHLSTCISHTMGKSR